jgi:methionyl-tRNA synthetase
METELVANLQTVLDRYTASLAAMQLRRAAADLRELWVIGNVYLDRAAPWTAIKEDRTRAASILRAAINLSRLYAIVGSPIIPDTCARLREALGVTISDAFWPKDAATELDALPPGHGFAVPPPLFKKITPEQIVDLSHRYGGEETAEAPT